jgi:hypothetical protein
MLSSFRLPFRFTKEDIMDMPATEEQIRNLAYRLWEEAGSPEGRPDEFWLTAQQQLANEPGIAPESAGTIAHDPAVSK